MSLFGHPLARELENWWRDHGGKHDDQEWIGFLTRFSQNLVPKLVELTSAHTNIMPTGEKGYGMSKVGGCTRAGGLKYLGFEGESVSGSTQFTFFQGHVLECAALAMLVSVGHDAGDSQDKVAIPEAMLCTATDGRLHVDGKPTMLSVKTAGYKKSGKERSGKYTRRGFPELPFEGVRKSQPGHWAQMQGEMHGAGVTQALYFVVSKDFIKAMEGDPYLWGKPGEGNGSGVFYTELVQYDPEFCIEHLVPVWQATHDDNLEGNPGRAFVIHNTENRYVELDIASESWQPNAGRTGTFNYCNYCDLLGACKTAPR